jgi:hypothetical protein
MRNFTMKVAAMAIVATVAIVANAAPGLAQSSAPDVETLSDKDVPGAVASRMKCKSPAGSMTRRPLSGGFVFIQSCAGSTEPQVRVVYATGRDGDGARLLQFHRPEGRRMSALATASVLSAENEISGTTGRLTRLICQAEARWRMEGKNPSPSLVYWRQTKDCDGKTGWRTVIGRAR